MTDGPAIRPAVLDDLPFIQLMMREANAGAPEHPRRPLADVLADPMASRYVEGWGRTGDVGRIAEDVGGERVGAAWYRTFAPDRPGYGFVAADVPELAIGVAEGGRGRGVGSALLAALIAEARAAGLPALSLGVATGNPAQRIYERLGFAVVASDDEGHVMRLEL